MADRGPTKVVSETREDIEILWGAYHLDILLGSPLSRVKGQLAGRALDVGCGDGRSLRLIDSYGVRSLGLDTRPSGRPVVKGTALHLPFNDHSFGVVVCLRTLQHLKDDAAALREMRRVLRPGGCIVVAVANKRSFSLVSLKSRGEWSGRNRIPYDWFRPYAVEEVNELLEREGFDIIESEVVGYAPELLRRRFHSLSMFMLKAIVKAERILESLPLIGPRGTHVCTVARLTDATSSSSP